MTAVEPARSGHVVIGVDTHKHIHVAAVMDSIGGILTPEGVTGPHSLVIVAVAFVALTAWKAPAWAVVVGAAGLGALLL